MSRKEDRLWSEGFERACDIARKKGLDGLFAEQRFRGITGFQGRLTSSDLDNSDKDVKNMIFSTLRIAYVGVLYDEFGFRGKRLTRFLHGVDKIASYLDHGWLYWIDIVDEIRQRVGIDLAIADGASHLTVYQRPANEDVYTELIDAQAWKARLDFLGLTDDGKQVTDPAGRWCWKYKNEYDKVQIYDELGGILLAVNCLGASKPGRET